MNRRRIRPQSRQQNQTAVERMYSGSGLGLIADMARVPNGGFGELYNARDFKTEVRGRRGSYLHSGVDYAIFPDEMVGTLQSILETSEYDWFENWNQKLFMIYSHADASDNQFQTAKDIVYGSGTITAYDIFKIVEVSDGQPEPTLIPLPIYMGNLMVPHIPEYQGVIGDPFEVWGPPDGDGVFSNKVYLYNWPPLNSEVLGSYLKLGYSFEDDVLSEEFSSIRLYILDYGVVDGGEGEQFITVQEVADQTRTFKGSFMQPIIHTSHFLQASKKVVILAGDRLYNSNSPLDGWREIDGIFDTYELETGETFHKRPFAGESLFHEIKNDLLLTNINGHYRIRFSEDNVHYWKINEQAPDKPAVAVPVKVWGFRGSSTNPDVISGRYQVVGFEGYNEGSYNDDPSTGNRAGETYYTGGQIL